MRSIQSGIEGVIFESLRRKESSHTSRNCTSACMCPSHRRTGLPFQSSKQSTHEANCFGAHDEILVGRKCSGKVGTVGCYWTLRIIWFSFSLEEATPRSYTRFCRGTQIFLCFWNIALIVLKLRRWRNHWKRYINFKLCCRVVKELFIMYLFF